MFGCHLLLDLFWAKGRVLLLQLWPQQKAACVLLWSHLFEVHTGGTPAADLTSKRLDCRFMHAAITSICETWYLWILKYVLKYFEEKNSVKSVPRHYWKSSLPCEPAVCVYLVSVHPVFLSDGGAADMRSVMWASASWLKLISKGEIVWDSFLYSLYNVFSWKNVILFIWLLLLVKKWDTFRGEQSVKFLLTFLQMEKIFLFCSELLW